MLIRGLSGAYLPVMAFSKTSGPATFPVFYPGDGWLVRITGGAPNAPVTVTGGLNGAVATTNMGSTDAAGSFQLSGKITADQLGRWFESWQVGGVDVAGGNFSFSVLNPPAAAVPPAAPKPDGDGPAAPPPAGNVPPVAGGPSFWFSSIPSVVWWVGGGLAAFSLLGGGRRR